MNEARWTRQWELFHAALEREPELRTAWLAGVCAGDAALAAEVDSLLRAHASAEVVIDRPPSAMVLEAELPGRFGPWAVLREIGRGGMGRVFEVERRDGEYVQRAALKLIDPMLAHGASLGRFLRERQILARLRHPRIARLLDGGHADGGQPWLVMEYVAGEPIDRWCDTHSSPLSTRLQLLAEVAEAVDFAHRQLIVHRDLKPSNVLVNAEGAPVLLDFGIARSLDPADTAQTEVGELRPLTPRYASPEQLLGEPVGVAGDIWSLGVLVFEVLSGELPYESAGLSWLELAQRLRAGGVRSLRATARGRRLPAELAWICDKALRAQAELRYATAQALADDLRAVLAHRPVAARPRAPAYVAAKFLRRHWPSVAAAMVFVFTVSAFVWRLSEESANTRRALAVSEVERERAQRVAEFLGGLFREADTTQAGGRVVTAREVLDRGRAQLQARDDLPPASRLLLLNTLASVYRNMGEYAAAGALLLEARGLLAQAESSEIEAETLGNLGAVWELAGRSREAREPLQRALALRRAATPVDPQALALAAERLAVTLQTLGEREPAGALFEEAWRIQSSTLPAGDTRRADAALRYGSWFWVAGRLDEAQARYAEALAVRRAQQPPDLPELARALDANGALAHAQGRFPQALPLYEEALTLRRRALGESHRLTADSLSNLGACLVDSGRAADAEAPLRGALSIYAEVLPADSVVPAKTANNLGLVLQARGDHVGARAQFESALALNRKAYGAAHPRVAGNLNNLALVAEAEDDLNGAERAVREAIGIIETAQGAEHLSLGFPLTNLGRMLLWQGDADGAAVELLRALRIRRAQLPVAHPLLGDTLAWLGLAQCESGARAEGLVALDEALGLRRSAPDGGAMREPDLRAMQTICGATATDAVLDAAAREVWIAERGERNRLVRRYLAALK